MRKILKISLFLILIVIAGGYGFLYHIQTRALPDLNKNLTIKGLENQVEVFRDEHGVPHIYASTETDLYKAVGYIMAQDRMWQMDLLRRATTGRLSEIFGADMVNTDLAMRRLRLSEKSDKLFNELKGMQLQSLVAFTEGINQYLDDYANKLPPEFAILGYKPEKWQPQHSINLIGYMAWDLTSGWRAEIILDKLKNKVANQKLQQIIPDLSRQNSIIFPDFKMDSTLVGIKTQMTEATAKLEELGVAIFYGSNNWAVSGKKSQTGKPIMANDMHLGLSAPGIWYQMHLVVEGKLNVTGVAIPGSPHIVAGHNEHIAWGMTNVMLDETDFYLETINPKNPNQYKLNGQWKDMVVKQELINIKDAEPQTHQLKYTHRGPIVSNFGNRTVSARWIGNEYSNELRSIYLLNRAKNWTDFREAVKTFIAVSQNIVYADVQGNIGLQTCAGVAIREGNGIDIYPGDTTQYDWKGLVPFEQLPYTFNPESGFVASANNKTVPDDYPHYISHWFFLSYRQERIVELLKEKEKLSIDDFARMHADQKSALVERFMPVILRIVEKNDTLKADSEIINSLKNWDFVMSPNSYNSSVFEEFMLHFIRNTAHDEMGDDLLKDIMGNKVMVRNFVKNIWEKQNCTWYDNVNTPHKTEQFNDIVAQSYADAIEALQKRYGTNTDNWQWGKIHQLSLKHPMGKVSILNTLFGLNTKAYAVGGSSHTVSPYSYSLNNAYVVTHGASHRHIYSTANWDNSQTIIPTGVSGIPASDFYCDQTQKYINNQYHADYTSRQKVQQNARYTMKFVPVK